MIVKFIRYPMQTSRILLGFDERYYLFCLIMLAATMVFSCSRSEEDLQGVSDNIPVYSIDELASVLPELKTDSVEAFDSPDFIEPYYMEPFPEGSYVAVNDRTENLIHLFDETGTHLGVDGGEGRGPGEFLGSMRLHAGQDNHLYVLDRRTHRITRFSVGRNGLNYDTSYSPDYEPGSWLQAMYVTEWGNFGVVRSMVDHSTGEDEFHLYKLDDNFNQEEHLFAMPGNEKMSLDEWNHIDHMAGNETLWDLDGEWFYYISSHSPVIHKYNLQTGEQIADNYFDLEEREITDETENNLMEYASSMINRFPVVKEKMETLTVLPLFQEFLVHNDNLYLMLFNLTSESTKIIRIKEATEEVEYINIPLELWRIQAGDGVIYGIETNDSESFIQIVNLEE